MGFVDPTGLGQQRTLDILQQGLAVLGMIPGVGEIFDVVNAGISFARGNYADAAIHLASAIPGIGNAVAGAKMAGGITTASIGLIKMQKTGSRVGNLANPNAIRFTQDSISTTFKDGRSVHGLINNLKSGAVRPTDLSPIRTFQQNGLTYTLDNRRLFAAHQAGVQVKTRPATSKELARELQSKFTTPNQGTIIGIRGELK